MGGDLRLIAQSIEFIETHLKEKLNVEQMADVAGFSKYHFSRLFDKYVGMSPYDYYRGRKVSETISYMKERQCKIIEAALEYGFSSPEVFVRACKGVFGKSPSAIRRMTLEGGTFEGIGKIDIKQLSLTDMTVHNYNAQFMILPELTLGGIGYFTDSEYSTVYDLPREQLEKLGGKHKEVFKLSWLEEDSMGYMHFVGVNLEGEGGFSQILQKKVPPKMAYLVFELMDKTSIEKLKSYIRDQVIPESDYELGMPLE